MNAARHTMMNKTTLALLAAAALLAACSDNPGTPDAAAGNSVPPSATASTSAWTQFVASLRNSETATPLEVNTVTPPVSESDPPLAI